MKKKNKKALGWWQKLNAGDPEKNMEIFNKNMTYNKTSETSSESSEAAMAEAIESIIENPQTNLEALKALELAEKFNSEKDLEDHFQKHCRGKLRDNNGKYSIIRPDINKPNVVIWNHIKNKKQYEKEAEDLQNTSVDNNNILGYEIEKGKDKYHFKYDKNKNAFVDFAVKDNGEDITISYYGLNPKMGTFEYLKKRNDDKNESNSFRDLSIGEALKELKNS